MGSPDPYGRTALHRAVIAGDLPATEAAIRAGEDLNAHESRSYTPLHFAVQEGFVDIAAALLGAGADVESRTDIGVTPLRLAAQRWKKSPDGAIIKLLKKYGASGTTKDDGGHTVTDMAKNLFRFPPELLELVEA